MSSAPTAEWNKGCEAYYMGVPVHHNPYSDRNKESCDPIKYAEWEDGWGYAWKSCGQPPVDCTGW